MTTPSLGRPVGADGEKTRRRILNAAMHCVARSGYSGTTIREIARAAGMSSAALYNYFPNKSELISAAIAARADTALPRLRRAAARPGTVVDRLDAVLDESGRLMREHPDLAAFQFAIRADNAVDMPVADTAGFEAMRKIIREIVADTSLSGAELDAAVEAIYALIYGLTELAATAPAERYQRALGAVKHLIRGTLFVDEGQAFVGKGQTPSR